jgi:hypothetical protein
MQSKMQSNLAPTSFVEATKVIPIAGTEKEFEANVPWDWCGGA